MKRFLYLVQARAELAEKHLELKSPRADVLIYTFDRKIDKPGFFYKPNTYWHQGRNILIEAAKKIPHRYDYYVLMDDDIKFRKGNWREFEEDVLKVKPDLCQPLYYSSGVIRKYSRITPFRYSEFLHFDSAFKCMSRELFFDKNLLPYETRCLDNESLGTSFQYSGWFWIKLFEYYSHKKILMLNSFEIINQRHDANYDSFHGYKVLFRLGKFRDPNFSNKFYKQMPITKFYSYLEIDVPKNLRRCIRVVEAKGLGLPPQERSYKADKKVILQLCKKLWAKKSYKYLLSFTTYLCYYVWVVKIPIYRHYIWSDAIINGLWRDLKLNLRAWLT